MKSVALFLLVVAMTTLWSGCSSDTQEVGAQANLSEVTKDQFDQWMEDQRLARELASGQAVADREKEWPMAELLPIGEQVYLTHCATCHQPDGKGQGITYPALDGSAIANGPLSAQFDIVMNGKAGTEMQAWAPQLSDRELAAVITYERNTWSNATGDVVQPRTIYAAR